LLRWLATTVTLSWWPFALAADGVVTASAVARPTAVTLAARPSGLAIVDLLICPSLQVDFAAALP
jgi:hypothetical protein